MTREAVGWLRISNDDAEGIEEQRRLLYIFAEQLGVTLTRVFEANDRSAYKGLAGTTEYDKLLSYLETERPSVLIGRERNRFYRNLADYAAISRLTSRLGITVYAVESRNEPIVFDTISEDLQAVIARDYSRGTSKRVIWKHDDLRAAGLPFAGGTRAYGYNAGVPNLDPAKRIRYGTQVIESEAAIIREIKDRLIRGESSQAICKDLNTREIPTAGGSRWKPATIKQIMTNPRYMGKLTHKGQVIGDGAWEAILTETDFAALKEIFAGRGRKTGRPSLALLSGLIHCGLCDSLMYADRKQDGRDIYRCSRAAGGCGKLSRSRKWLDELVTETALTFFAQEVQEERAAGVSASQAEIDSLALELARLDQEIATVKAARDSFEDLQDYMDELNRLRKARKQVTGTSAKKTVEVLSYKEAAGMSEARWNDMSLEAKREYIRYWLAPIIIHKPAPGPIGPHSIFEVTFGGLTR